MSTFTQGRVNSTGFDITGEDIENQFLFEGAVGKLSAGGWNAGISAFGEVGDSRAYGGRLNIGKTF